MSIDVIDRVLTLLSDSSCIELVDITGGAPELNPHFRYLVTECRRLGKQVINRCNLTVLFEKGQEDTAEFLSEQRVHVVASLPCYSKNNVDAQRGNGVFDQSILALQQLNKLGYGQVGSGRILDLVYNPVGASLPPAQAKLEAQYRVELEELFGIVFNNLYTITNMPIKRFHYDLKRSGKFDQYMELLVENFNAQAALNVSITPILS
jgi:radical SAM/Cys-rich protein